MKAAKDAERLAEEERLQEEHEFEQKRMVKVLRHLNRHRQLYGRRASFAVREHQRLFEELMTEKEDCLDSLTVAKGKVYRTDDKHGKAILQQQLRDFDVRSEEIKQIKADIDAMELEERNLDAKIEAAGRKRAEMKLASKQAMVVCTQTCLRRSEHAANQYGLQLCENSCLAHKLHYLQMDHAQVARTHRILERELRAVSAELASHINEAKDMYNKRDTSKRAISKLMEMGDKAKVAFENELQEIDININFLKHLEVFTVEKNKMRPNEWQEMKRKTKGQVTAAEKENMFYESALSKIRSELGEHNMEVVIKTFLELAEENYMLFRNLSETREGAQEIQVETDEIQEQIRVLNERLSQMEREKVAQKKELDEKIDMCRHLIEQKEFYLAKAEAVIQDYIDGIVTLLKNLGYSKSEMDKLAGIFRKVEERNIRTFLGEIEQYVNKICEIQAFVEYKVWDHKRRTSVTRYPVLPLPPRLTVLCRFTVVPPEDKGDEDLSTDTTRRPLSRMEVAEAVDRQLESRPAGHDEADLLPEAIMTDPVTDAIGDTPGQKELVGKSVDIF